MAQRGTALAWDARSLAPLAPAQSRQDRRTAARVEGLRAAGIPLATLSTATKFEWWLANEPRIAAAAREQRLCFGTPDVWLTARLTKGAVFATEPGHAGCTALFDGVAGDWAQGLLDLFGVPRAALPRLVRSAALVGETAPGLFASPIRLGARAGDQQASAFAQGVHCAGRAKLTLGTSAMLDVHTGDAPREPPPARTRFRSGACRAEPLSSVSRAR